MPAGEVTTICIVLMSTLSSVPTTDRSGGWATGGGANRLGGTWIVSTGARIAIAVGTIAAASATLRTRSRIPWCAGKRRNRVKMLTIVTVSGEPARRDDRRGRASILNTIPVPPGTVADKMDQSTSLQ